MAEHDAETGQFTSAEPLYGLAGIEQEAGYTPMPEREREDEADELTAAEAAEELDRQHTAMAGTTVRTYFDGNDFASEHETITIERAARDLAEVHAEEEAEREAAEIEAVRAEVDKLRGTKPEAEAKQAEAEPALEGEDAEIAEIERALNNPKVKAAIQQQIGETEQARQAYAQGVEVANEFARAQLMHNFPEFAQLPLDQWDGALMSMRQTNPERYNQVIGGLQRVVQLRAAQQQQQTEAADRERQEVETYSRAETARFDAMIKGETKESRRAVEDSIVAAIKDFGGDTAEFFQLLKTSKLMNSAVAQRFLWEVGKARLEEGARKSAAKAVPKNLPPVQRPGARGAPARSGADIAALERRLNETGSEKDAVALYLAQQSRKKG